MKNLILICSLFIITSSLSFAQIDKSTQENLVQVQNKLQTQTQDSVQLQAEVDPATLTEELPPPQVPEKVVKAETQIPVNLESVKKESTSSSIAMRAFLSLGILAGIGISAYLLIGKYRRMKIGGLVAPQIKVLTQHYLGPKKSLAIIRVAGESILIGVTDHNINMIKSLSLLDEEIPEIAPQNFDSVLKDHSLIDGEEFAIKGIKDFVNMKLKNMRTLE